jgi:hypothetical protein
VEILCKVELADLERIKIFSNMLAFLFYRELFYKSVISMIVLSLVIGILQDILLPYGIKNIWIGSLVGGYWMGLTEPVPEIALAAKAKAPGK